MTQKVYQKKRLRKPGNKTVLPSYHDFLWEVYGKHPLSEDRLSTTLRRALRTYHLWIFCKLAEGQCVNMYDLFTIFASKRAERNNVGSARVHQPEQYVLKLNPTAELKVHLRRLAQDKTKKYYDYRSPIDSPAPGTPERLARDSRRRTVTEIEALFDRLRTGDTHPVDPRLPE